MEDSKMKTTESKTKITDSKTKTESKTKSYWVPDEQGGYMELWKPRLRKMMENMQKSL